MRIRITAIIMCLSLIGLISGCKKEEKPAEKPAEPVKHEVHWGYSGEGAPQNWGSLKPEYAACSTGDEQSPVDFVKTYKTDVDKIEFTYKDSPLKVMNNGHSIQVSFDPGNMVVIDGQQYELVQFHFHAPSEHSINGQLQDMEVHFVHKNQQGKLAVVGAFMKKGAPNKLVQVIWDSVPAELNSENAVTGISVNPSGLLPKDKKAFHYYGSLTTPPCTEGVNWTVLKSPIEVSEEQINKFRSIMGVENNRPVQPVNERFVLESR